MAGTFPSLATAGALASAPSLDTETRSVRAVARSWTNTSSAVLVSPGTRFVAPLMKATYRPSALIAGAVEVRFA